MATSVIDVQQQSSSQIEWIEQYSPETALFRGESYYLVKRAFDLTLCILAMPLLLPLFLLCALAIKIESPGGPVVFTQLRTGKNGKRFKIYKFRTMV
ncbi:MAG TPA: sugar transferase, partial [Roseiflexaceae bacterium]|nr:sugar transferase [Roseiflexaceae bacterium]